MSKHKMLQIQSIKMALDKKRWRVFGEWLKEKRDHLRLSQDIFGRLVGLDRQTIYRLENALSGTKRETVIQIAESIGADVNEALSKAGFASDKTEIPEDIAIIGYDELNSDDIRDIVEFIKFKKSQKSQKQ